VNFVRSPPPQPDFAAIVRSLNSRGINRSAIARELRVSPSAVCRWLAATREPSYRNGSALLFLAGSVRGERE
jgi:predicted transcriptional regulator